MVLYYPQCFVGLSTTVRYCKVTTSIRQSALVLLSHKLGPWLSQLLRKTERRTPELDSVSIFHMCKINNEALFMPSCFFNVNCSENIPKHTKKIILSSGLEYFCSKG